MKQEKIIIANDGPDKNVMILSPPMCFTCDNARRVVSAFDKCLTEIESGVVPEALENGQVVQEPTELTIPLEVVSGQGFDADSDDSDGPGGKRARYEDLD